MHDKTNSWFFLAAFLTAQFTSKAQVQLTLNAINNNKNISRHLYRDFFDYFEDFNYNSFWLVSSAKAAKEIHIRLTLVEVLVSSFAKSLTRSK